MENKLIETIKKLNLETNGECFFSDDNFHNNPNLVCYVPENAEEESDMFSRNDLEREVSEWLSEEETIEYLLEVYDGTMPEINSEFINSWVEKVYSQLSWEFPSTYLNSLLQ
jgi:hypothetical protein